ncbi:MAG: Uma2 family endonuclease [Planctomycetes bacterium]|nr:Uma2 family endonuclease [Planctomycetota bacterium]
MGLDRFARAKGIPGYLYELAKGVVTVVDIPGLPHGLVVQALDRQLRGYDLAHPGVIHYMAGEAECALRLPGMQSERHPDRAIYLSPPPEPVEPWDDWVPEIVIEVVSKGQESRDYGEKREEYLAAGIREYWVVDPAHSSVVFLRRRGDRWAESELKGPRKYRTPLLPGFELDLALVF